MKYLILENDCELSEYLLRYLKDNDITNYVVIGMADQRDAEEILEQFSKCDVLMFQPTMITYSQYNTMLMLLYSLISENKLSIKEVHIFSHRDDIESDLMELWEDKTEYLDVVLEHVKVFNIMPVIHDKTRLFLKNTKN